MGINPDLSADLYSPAKRFNKTSTSRLTKSQKDLKKGKKPKLMSLLSRSVLFLHFWEAIRFGVNIKACVRVVGVCATINFEMRNFGRDISTPPYSWFLMCLNKLNIYQMSQMKSMDQRLTLKSEVLYGLKIRMCKDPIVLN
ncbi:unnamed protein product [Allacma fusca]|uniref:Uncharacterized protein n=1 Tax=Allacma fusca TaxID=39272 RepID=A0A8J2PXU2_9HEXA|nr:unnamed protein product [Allacma fusca]